jgi:hypothetical protein
VARPRADLALSKLWRERYDPHRSRHRARHPRLAGGGIARSRAPGPFAGLVRARLRGGHPGHDQRSDRREDIMSEARLPSKEDPHLRGLKPGDRIRITWCGGAADSRMMGRTAAIVRQVPRGVVLTFDAPIGSEGATFMLGLDPVFYTFEKLPRQTGSGQSKPKA